MRRNRSTGAVVFAGLVIASVVTTGSGAFSLVAADRPAEVVIASDLEGAYLRLAPHDGPNGVFARDANADGTLELQLDDGTPGVLGAGPNPEAVTRLRSVFDVTNQGTTELGIWLDDHGVSAVTLYTTDAAHGSLESRRSMVPVAPGETVVVSIEIDARGDRAGDVLLSGITVHAEAVRSP